VRELPLSHACQAALQRSLLSAFLTCAIVSSPVAAFAGGIAADDDVTLSIRPPVSRTADQTRPAEIRLDVNLVLIPVTVTDSYERPVHGLNKDDFRLFEDRNEQKISQFFQDESPISVGVILDGSNSMRNRMVQSRKAITEFLNLTSPDDEFFLLTFNDRPEMMQPFTKNAEDIENVLPSIQPHGWTSLYDAIYLGISRMKHAGHSRKILLVLSDGDDNNSRYNERELTELVKEADVRIFAISILDRSPSLERICDESGGRAYRVRKIEELPDLAAKISEELHSEYVLGYFPTATQRDGKYRRIGVQLANPELRQSQHASWRRGYYGPGW
jgi:Ca-activated chloride channel homolog